MRLGFYDSGLGGLSVLREFIKRFGSAHSYKYLGDSARAPYGTKSREEIISCVEDILNYFESSGVDLVVSACNTSSVYLDEMNLTRYPFKIISLFAAMSEYFATANCSSAALLATPSTINSKRYLEWSTKISPVACPELVPLIESGELAQAQIRFSEYLAELPKEISSVIIGCTHYSFLTPSHSRFTFIDPAVIVAEQFAQSYGGQASPEAINAEIYCTGNLELFNSMLGKLLGANYSAKSSKL